MINYKLALDLSQHDTLTLGILSDTHGYLHPKIANMITHCDIALHAGDVMGAESLLQLQPKMGKSFAVKGNNDAHSTWAQEHHEMLDDIPDLLELTLPGGILVMEHSHRLWHTDTEVIHRRLRDEHADARLIVYGHTHVRTIDNSHQPPVINPGAAGKVRVHGGASCVKLSVNEQAWSLQEYVF